MSHPTIGPAPRTIQPRVGYKSGAGCAKLFILPHMLIGVGVIMVFILKIAMGLVGTKTDATVLEKTWHRGSKGGTTYRVRFAFTAGGERHEGKSQVSQEAWEKLPERGFIPIVYLPIYQEILSDYKDPKSFFPSGTGLMLWIGLFWNGIMGVFVYFIYVVPRRRKRLVIDGAEADGVITGKEMHRGSKGGITYQVRYRYAVLGETLHGKQDVPKGTFEAALEGLQVSVAYDQQMPSRSVAVDLSEWEIVGAPRLIS